MARWRRHFPIVPSHPQASTQTLMTQGPLKRTTLTEAVLDILRQRILSGHYPDGEPLRQEALSKEFEVSRVPVREAFRQLEAEGLVKHSPHRGAVVSALSPPEIAELMDLRAMLEADLLRRAIPNMDAADIKAIDKALADYTAAVRKGQTGRLGALNRELHEAMYRPADRPRSLAVVRNLNDQTERYVQAQIALTDFAEASVREHTELVELCKRRDAEAACAFLVHHIEQAGQLLNARLAAASGG